MTLDLAPRPQGHPPLQDKPPPRKVRTKPQLHPVLWGPRPLATATIHIYVLRAPVPGAGLEMVPETAAERPQVPGLRGDGHRTHTPSPARTIGVVPPGELTAAPGRTGTRWPYWSRMEPSLRARGQPTAVGAHPGRAEGPARGRMGAQWQETQSGDGGGPGRTGPTGHRAPPEDTLRVCIRPRPSESDPP